MRRTHAGEFLELAGSVFGLAPEVWGGSKREQAAPFPSAGYTDYAHSSGKLKRYTIEIVKHVHKAVRWTRCSVFDATLFPRGSLASTRLAPGLYLALG
jgi:hypothetical protein